MLKKQNKSMNSIVIRYLENIICLLLFLNSHFWPTSSLYFSPFLVISTYLYFPKEGYGD